MTPTSVGGEQQIRISGGVNPHLISPPAGRTLSGRQCAPTEMECRLAEMCSKNAGVFLNLCTFISPYTTSHPKSKKEEYLNINV